MIALSSIAIGVSKMLFCQWKIWLTDVACTQLLYQGDGEWGKHVSEFVSGIVHSLSPLTDGNILAYIAVFAAASITVVHGACVIAKLYKHTVPILWVDIVLCLCYSLLTWVYATHAILK